MRFESPEGDWNLVWTISYVSPLQNMTNNPYEYCFFNTLLEISASWAADYRVPGCFSIESNSDVLSASELNPVSAYWTRDLKLISSMNHSLVSFNVQIPRFDIDFPHLSANFLPVYKLGPRLESSSILFTRSCHPEIFFRQITYQLYNFKHPMSHWLNSDHNNLFWYKQWPENSWK